MANCDSIKPAGVDALRAFQQKAPTTSVGRQAYGTWMLAQVLGWVQARELTSRATWYRHVEVIKAAGVPIPAGAPGNRLRGKRSANREAISRILSPWQAVELVGRSVVLVKDWDDIDRKGATGEIRRLVFDDGVWSLGVDFRWSYEEIPLSEFLSYCEVKEG